MEDCHHHSPRCVPAHLSEGFCGGGDEFESRVHARFADSLGAAATAVGVMGWWWGGVMGWWWGGCGGGGVGVMWGWWCGGDGVWG